MGHYCRICGRVRPNEAFSGRGHRDHVCKKCQRLPKERRDYVERMGELYRFPEQSHISAKNVARLAQLCQHANPKVQELARLIADVAQVKPYKRRRLKFIRQKHAELFARMRRVLGDAFWDEVLAGQGFELDEEADLG